MAVTSPATLAGRRSIVGRNVRGRIRLETSRTGRALGARLAKKAVRQSWRHSGEKTASERGAPGLIGIREKYNLYDPRLVWYRDESRQSSLVWRNTKEHGRFRKFAYPEGELNDAVRTEDVHWLTGLGALDRVKIVLVGSQSAGNVGSICRVASNFECRNICLVNPECDHTADEARQMAVNPVAKTLLEDITVAKSMTEALAECTMAIGFTRREGRQRVIDVPYGNLCLPTKGTVTALVFGREDDGLTNEELLYCTHTCRIPSTKWEGSLNVSHAVALSLSKIYTSYEKYQSKRTQPNPQFNEYIASPDAASLREVNMLIKRFRHVVKKCNSAASVVSKPEFTTPDRLLYHLRKLVYRAKITQREVNTIHGFLTLVDTNAKTVEDLFTDLQDKASDGEPEEEYEEFVEKALACEKAYQEEQQWEEYDYSETDEEEARCVKEELESY